jgi:FkbM family methyltransferase
MPLAAEPRSRYFGAMADPTPPEAPTVRTLRIGGRTVRFAVSEQREDERLGAVAANEGQMLRRLLDAAREGDTFFDVGANIGTITLPVAMTGVECLAFEPAPANAARLAENAGLNRLGNVTVIEAAMWSERGTVALRVDGMEGAGTSRVVEAGGDGTVEVPAATLDQFAGGGAAAPDLLKIDVEGGELEALRGAEATLGAGRVREVFVETHPLALEERGASEAEVAALLGELGYAEVWATGRATETHRHFRRRD